MLVCTLQAFCHACGASSGLLHQKDDAQFCQKDGHEASFCNPSEVCPLRRPKAKKLHLDEHSQLPLPPPTPIPTMQAIGVALGIDPSELSVEKLMASPRPAEEDDGPHDD